MHPKIYIEEEHSINQELIDKDALDVIFQLKDAGFHAFLVGGSVRDLILKKTPKDYDISTSARPEEIKKLFQRRCLLIGKRFRLAHIRCGGQKVLEVSTFRTGDLDSTSLIVRDNRWGTEEDDVLRRDFTINAIFYDPTTKTVIDYVHGFEDIKKKTLRLIGDPTARFRQDPVRMIRLLKFQARFDFHVDHHTELALNRCKEEILKSAPPRLLEEIFRMLESCSSEKFFQLLADYDFLELLFPAFHQFLVGENREIAFKYLNAIDQYQAKKKRTLDRGLLMAALIFPILEQELLILSSHRQSPISFSDIAHLSYTLIRGIDTSSFTHFPKKILSIAHAISVNQFRLTPLKGPPKISGRFSHSEEGNLSLEFLELRSIVHPHIKTIYSNWKNGQNHDQ